MVTRKYNSICICVYVADIEAAKPPSVESVLKAVSGVTSSGLHPHVTSLLPLWAELVKRDLSLPQKTGELLILELSLLIGYNCLCISTVVFVKTPKR